MGFTSGFVERTGGAEAELLVDGDCRTLDWLIDLAGLAGSVTTYAVGHTFTVFEAEMAI
jgi:hypothetical protein